MFIGLRAHSATLIQRFEDNFELISKTNDAIFKRRAVRCFQDTWFKPDSGDISFTDRFKAAAKKRSVLLDSGQVCRIAPPLRAVSRGQTYPPPGCQPRSPACICGNTAARIPPRFLDKAAIVFRTCTPGTEQTRRMAWICIKQRILQSWKTVPFMGGSPARAPRAKKPFAISC